MYLKTGIKSECTGCAACVDVCPRGCISMLPDESGFLFPVIDREACIHCGACDRTCPDFQVEALGRGIQDCWYATNPDNDISRGSTSAGIFYTLAESVISQGGVVFGAAWAEGYRLQHQMASTPEELRPLMGSKYVQSDCTGVYRAVQNSLIQGKKVMFVGTPCQAAGLRRFLRKEDPNLLLVDILCHGVPPQKLLDRWIAEEESKNGNITLLKFRDKAKYGWQHCLTYETTKDGQTQRFDILPAFHPYYHLFLQGYSLRESCYMCRYACRERVGDITLGDYWGAAVDPRLSYTELQRGVSLVLTNTERGELAIQTMKSIKLQPCNLEEETRRNLPLSSPALCPVNRDTILQIGSVDEMYHRTISKKALFKERVKQALPRKLYYFISGCLSRMRCRHSQII